MSIGNRDSVRWGVCRTTEFDTDAADTIVILPVGSTEQHGPHLPVEVDTRLVTEIAERTAGIVRASRPVLVIPTLWVSLAEHHMSFAGTLTLDLDTIRAVLRCLVRSLSRRGFRRVLILNGHGGNMSALPLITDELSRELDVSLACATYWVVAAEAFGRILEGQPNLRHACEAETAMMLALAPELVDMDAARKLEAPADGLHAPTGLHRWRRIEEWTRSGVVGTPGLASAEKGVRLLDAAAVALASRLVDEATWSFQTVESIVRPERETRPAR